MNNDKLAVLLGTCIIPAIVKDLKISDNEQVTFLNKFYQSLLYDILIHEETGLWHLSPTTLAEIYEYEQKTGILELPEEL
jgi:beta-lactamase class D